MVRSTDDLFAQLSDRLREISHLSKAVALLNWDQQTYMPVRAAEERARQIATLSELRHHRATAPEFIELVELLRNRTDMGPERNAIVREIWRDLEREVKVPASLVAAIAEAEGQSHTTWLQARSENSFLTAAPRLQQLLDLKREYADVIRGERTRYDALLDLYEPDARAADIAPMFAALSGRLQGLLSRIIRNIGEHGVPNPAHGSFPISQQSAFFQNVVRSMGFDFARGRLDPTVHPFCSEIGLDDVRLTTNYREDNLPAGLFGTIHEAGHGLYEQGFLEEYRHTPLAHFCSLGIHESQSLFWERCIARRRDFWSYWYPRMQRQFPEALEEVDGDDYYIYLCQVKPSLIRIHADEVTYGLHIIIRFELEQALVNGELEVSSLPECWNNSYGTYLNRVPTSDLEGVLQDTHWYSGLFGYFPTYLLGAMYAAQLAQTMEAQQPELFSGIGRGELLGLRDWLREHIHQYGRQYTAAELTERATGSELSESHLVQHLEQRYGSLF